MNTESTYTNQWWHNACSKCHGSLFLCQDNYGYYRKCINCGEHHYQLPKGLDLPQVKLHPQPQPAAA